MSRLLVRSLCLFGLLVGFLPAAGSRADIPPGPPPSPPVTAKPAPAGDSEGFVPERRPATMSTVEEGLPAGPLVAGAYGFIWSAVLIFFGLAAHRTRKLDQEVALLSERLASAAAPRAS